MLACMLKRKKIVKEKDDGFAHTLLKNKETETPVYDLPSELVKNKDFLYFACVYD